MKENEIDLSNYTVYKCKDGRSRVYNKTTHSVTSYPRLLLEMVLGRKLEKGEDVHHIDEDFANNDISNLEVISHSDHCRWHSKYSEKSYIQNSRKYFDKEMTCPICGKTFIWTAGRQSNAITKGHAGPFCSKRCAGLYGANIQNNKDPYDSTAPCITALKRKMKEQ